MSKSSIFDNPKTSPIFAAVENSLALGLKHQVDLYTADGEPFSHLTPNQRLIIAKQAASYIMSAASLIKAEQDEDDFPF